MHKAKLCVQVLCLTICDQAHVAALRDIGFDVSQYFPHDALPQAVALMLLEDSNVHNLIEAPTIAYDSPHSHRLRAMKNLDSEEGVGQPPYRSFSSLLTQS